MKTVKLAAALGAAATFAVVMAAPANATQYCASKGPWNVCLETHSDGLWHARGWGPTEAWELLLDRGTLLAYARIPPGGGNITTGGSARGTTACVAESLNGPYYQCITRFT